MERIDSYVIALGGGPFFCSYFSFGIVSQRLDVKLKTTVLIGLHIFTVCVRTVGCRQRLHQLQRSRDRFGHSSNEPERRIPSTRQRWLQQQTQ